MPAKPGSGQNKEGSQELHPGLHMGGGHSTSVTRKLSQEPELGIEAMYSDTGCRHPNYLL